MDGYLETLLLSSVSEYHDGMSDNNKMISDEAVELYELMHQKITERLPSSPTKDQVAAHVDAAVSAAVQAGFRRVEA